MMGLCGTGSKDLVVDDAFVPEYRTHSYRDAFLLKNPGAAVNDGPLYRLPFGSVFPACIASPAIGAALGALEAFREQSKTRLATRDRSARGRGSVRPVSPGRGGRRRGRRARPACWATSRR